MNFIKKNIAILLIGAVIGAIAAGLTVFSTMAIAHNKSKAKATVAHEKQITSLISSHERVLVEKNTLIAQCISKYSTAYTNNNKFNPQIAKNKKGNVIIDLMPKIKQELTAAEPEQKNFKEGDTIQDLTLIYTKHLTRRQKRRIYK